MSSLILNFWYGRIALWKSYWLVGEILNTIIILFIYNIEIYFFQNLDLYNQIFFLNFEKFSFLSKIFLFLWTIFITVGIWRSAESYKGNFIWIVITLIVISYRIFTLRLLIF